VNDPTKARGIKVAASLLSPTAFGLALDVVSTLEANGVGIRPDTARSDGYTGIDFGTCLAMMVWDAFLYAGLAWFLHHTWPQEFGLQKAPWFLCTRAYWVGGGGSGDADVASCMAALRRLVTGGGRRAGGTDGGRTSLLGAVDGVGDTESGGVSDALVASGHGYEDPGPHLTSLASAQRVMSVRGLKKVFSTPDGPKTAVAGVDLDFFEGQITCLLGHNGAG
jgi:hypothetical protein